MTDVESLSASLVREYLSRKGFKRSLRVLDDEFPRKEDSVRNRVVLAKELKIEKLLRMNKELEDPLRTMIEVMVKYFKTEKVSSKKPQQNSSEEVTRSRSIKKSSSNHDVRRDSLSGHNFDLDQQLDTALRITNDKDSLLRQNDRRKSKSDATQRQETSVALSLQSGKGGADKDLFGNDVLASELRRSPSKGSLEPLDHGLKGKIKSQGPIQSTVDRSRRQRSKKAIDMKINGSLSGSFGDEFIKPSQSKERSSDSLHGLQKLSLADDHDITERRLSRNSKDKIDINSERKGRRTSPTKSASDIMIFDDLDDDLSDDGVGIGLPVQKLISKLHETSSSMTLDVAMNLKNIIFGSSIMSFNPEWRNQSFSFCDISDLKYGIVQTKGGPCGVLAAVQATILKHLLFSKDPISQLRRPPEPSSKERTSALVESICEILWRAGSRRAASVVIPATKGKFIGGGRYKSDGLTETITIYDFKDQDKLKSFVSQNVGQFESESSSGCILFVYSLIFSRSIKKPKGVAVATKTRPCIVLYKATGNPRIKSDMDESNGTLIGSHGYCTQELVNLCLTGNAVSNVFDGVMELDSGGPSKSKLKGIEKQCDIGLLSLFEHYESCIVGDNYKIPRYPIWVVCSESHFSVLFSINERLLLDRKYQRQFDLFYYDGLARQDEEIRLSIDTRGSLESDSDDLIPPLEHCIRTKWKNAKVDWNNTEPIL